MKGAKKYLILPRTLSVCIVGIFVFVGLVGCKAASEEDVSDALYADFSNGSGYYVQQEDERFVVAQQNDEVIAPEPYQNPYAEEKTDNNEPTCPKAKKGQNAGKTPCSRANKVAADEQNVGSLKFKDPKVSFQAGPALNIETPARCEITGRDNSIISSIPLGSDAFKLTRVDNSDPLPRFEVNNYTFKKKPLDTALQKLVKEADIKVFSDDALFPEVSGENVRGELSAVVDELASAADIFYRYNANKKQLFLSRWAPFIMKVPGGRIGMYTILDALRGANITNVQPDFGANEIYMRLNIEKQKKVEGLIKTIEQSPNLLLFDVQVYRLETNGNLSWQQIANDYGVNRINSSVNGIMGRLVSVGPQKIRQSFVEILRRYVPVNLVSEGVVIMPNGWKVRFDIGQCSKYQSAEQKLSMLFQSNILTTERAESNIALDTPTGEITSFHTVYNIDDTLNIIAVKGKALNPEWGNDVEYIITLKPKLVRLIK